MRNNQKFLKNILLLILLLWAIPTLAITYEDAEDNATTGWVIYTGSTKATIKNIYDINRGSQVIELNGMGLNSGYMLGSMGGWGNPNAWNNRVDKKIKWSMKYSEKYIIYISVQTQKGHRLLAYTNSDSNNGISFGTIHHGLGQSSSNGTWQTFTRDLEADLKEFESDNNITSIDAFLIRGSGYIDDVMSLEDLNPEATLIPEDTVVVGNLMWEDTSHIQSVEENWVNYNEAVAYCSNLELGGFNDWRVPHAEWNDSIGYNRTTNELLSIRVDPLDLNGEVWYNNGDNYDQLDTTSRSIIEPFAYMDQGGVGYSYWTDDNMGGNTGHLNVIFNYGLYNMDGWMDDWNSSVRCVRTLQAGDSPLVVDAGPDQNVEINHPITITGSVTSSSAISSYEWKYGANVVGTTPSFEFTPTSLHRHILVLKVTDENGNVASDVMHLNVTEANEPPTVDAGEDKSVQLGQSVTISGSANDDSAIAEYEWKEGSSILANTASFNYTPSSVGTKTLTLTVTDDDGATASDTMQVEVTEAPDSTPNAFSFTDVTNVERWSEQRGNITVSGINTPATISIVNGAYSLDGGTTWTTDAGTVVNGVNVIVRHYASGEYGTSVNTVLTVGGVSDTFTSTTETFVDQAPEVMIMNQTTTYNQTVYLGEDSLYVDSMISDDVGVTYCKWEDSDGAIITEATIDPAEQYPFGVCKLDLSPFTEVGEYSYRLTATDTLGQSNSNELNITVLPNSIPTADIGEDRTILVGTTLNITAIVNDADNDDMNYQWMYGVKDSGVMYGAGSNLEFSHQFNDVGDYVVRFRVADIHNASTTKEINVTVIASNDG